MSSFSIFRIEKLKNTFHPPLPGVFCDKLGFDMKINIAYTSLFPPPPQMFWGLCNKTGKKTGFFPWLQKWREILHLFSTQGPKLEAFEKEWSNADCKSSKQRLSHYLHSLRRSVILSKLHETECPCTTGSMQFGTATKKQINKDKGYFESFFPILSWGMTSNASDPHSGRQPKVLLSALKRMQLGDISIGAASPSPWKPSQAAVHIILEGP